MEGIRIAFLLAKCDRDKASELVKRLVGQATSGHGGKYAYRRKGFLDEIPHRRPIRGVVIARTEDAGRVVAVARGARARGTRAKDDGVPSGAS